MFHVERLKKLITAAVALCTAAAAASAQQQNNEQKVVALPCSEIQYPGLNLPLATANSEVLSSIEKGFVDLILGWEEHACIHFAHAIEAGDGTEDDSLMAYCGMLLAANSAGAKDANRMALADKIDSLFSTPVEQFYLAALLKLAEGDIAGAASDFEKRALQYKRDVFSAAWAVMLLHCAEKGYDSQGSPLPYQKRALDLASQFYQQHPQNAIACYLRGYVEEGAPKVSEEALEASLKAVELCSGHPMPSLLCGHLLYRSERVDEAVKHLHNAVQFTDLHSINAGVSSTKLIASLYEVTALWSVRKENEAMQLLTTICKLNTSDEKTSAATTILKNWEAKSFALRCLVMRTAPPTVKEIREASSMLVDDKSVDENDPVCLLRDCLRASLYTRARMAQNDVINAGKSLKLAQDSLRKFEESKADVMAKGSAYITPWLRAHEACRLAVLAAGAAVTSDNSEESKKLSSALVNPSTMLMPPVLPVQYGPEPEKKSVQKSSSTTKSKSTGSTQKRKNKKKR